MESAPEERCGKLASYEDILDGISMIKVQLEAKVSLLSNLRGDLLALDHEPLSRLARAMLCAPQGARLVRPQEHGQGEEEANLSAVAAG